MISCKRCKLEKACNEFKPDARYMRGYTSWCKSCHRERNLSWAKENRDRLSTKAAQWRVNNIDKARDIDRGFKKRNKDALAAKHAEWAKNNKGKRTAVMAKRKAAKLMATPRWANLDAIKKVYEQSAIWQRITNQRLHVDHIIPLQGETVCGLHCEQNLRIVEASYNESKRNKLVEDAYKQPDMFIPQPSAKPKQDVLL